MGSERVVWCIKTRAGEACHTIVHILGSIKAINEGSLSNLFHLFRNPGYAGSYSTAGTCTWTFPKTSSDVCRVRLEFEELSTAAPSDQGECATDYFQATGAATGTTQGSAGNLSPKICGINTGNPGPD